MRAEVDEGCPGGRMFGESLATTLAVHLMRRYAVFPGKLELNRQGLPERRLRAVVDYIEAHLSEDVTLGQLANLAHMSQFHLGHLFKQSTGLSPHQYLLRRRIAKAKTLLATGKLALAEISCMLGFASQTHFTTVFRKFAGITPLAYRNKL
jgi:AraC family transcriptional regulator